MFKPNIFCIGLGSLAAEKLVGPFSPQNMEVSMFRIISAFVVFTFVSMPAFGAVDMKLLVSELIAQQKELGLMEHEAKEAKQEEAAIVAEDKQLKRDEQRIQREATEWQMDNSANEDRMRNWSGMGCVAGKRSTDIALVNRCNALAGEISASTTTLQARGEQLIAQKKQNESARTAISRKTLENAKRQNAANAAINDLTRRINAIRAFLSGHCTSVPTTASDEAVKHGCGNIQFDGAAPTLPPCETEACKKYDAMHRRQ